MIHKHDRTVAESGSEAASKSGLKVPLKASLKVTKTMGHKVSLITAVGDAESDEHRMAGAISRSPRQHPVC